jgi:hypothetical protein
LAISGKVAWGKAGIQKRGDQSEFHQPQGTKRNRRFVALNFGRRGFNFALLNGITRNESMNESSDELTPRENFAASNYKNSEATFRNALIRRLTFIIPSLGLMVVWLITNDPAYAYMGYGLLLYQAVNSIFLMKKGLQTTSKVISKYEKKIQDKQDVPE